MSGDEFTERRPTTTAIILLSYNRPRLVLDALASIVEQTTGDWHCYVMDDGSTAEVQQVVSSLVRRVGIDRFTVSYGIARSTHERQAHLPYSWQMNRALTQIAQEGRRFAYVCGLCDDDFLYPEAIESRVNFLEAHPEAHACYGRLRAVHCGPVPSDWNETGAPTPGRAYPRPHGITEYRADKRASKVYFGSCATCLNTDGDQLTDPQTGAPYVEQGFWQSAPFRPGRDSYSVDHGQALWRTECLRTCRPWAAVDGRTLYWNERLEGNVGDASFFEALGEVHEFHSVGAWCVTKRYHSYGDGRLQEYARTGGRRE